jgi:phosphatidylglycerol:prolipoprotein diacylglycerol transferase
MFAASIPLGYTFGRLGNFINAELYGRVTTSPIGMIFPDTDGLPRHPSQLYEMIFEGVVLWAIIWFFRNRKPFEGFLIGLYFLGYGFFRFIIEFFREPDSHMGFPILNFTTGQILCFLMILFGIIWIIYCSKLPKKETVTVNERNKQRKLRKKLR